MKISTFLYTIKRGFQNLFSNKWYSLASIATIAACLFLFGILYSIVANFQHMVQGIQEVVSITVFFEKGLEDSRIEEIGKIIQNRTEVAEIRFTTAEEAWQDFQVEFFGDRAEDFLAGYPNNPLENSANYEVFPTDVSAQDSLVTYIESIPGVRMVRRDDILATTLSGINILISYVTIGIIVILLAVSIFLISNTVTMGISVRKAEINIMKYIGATDYFVRAPFVLEGMLIGLMGAAIPLVLIHEMYNAIMNYALEYFEGLSQILNFLSVDVIFAFLTPVCLIVGVGIGFLGSFTTVKKHLNV